MGSVSIYMPKLFGVSTFVEILGVLGMLFVDWDYSWAFLLAVVFCFIIFSKYCNQDTGHKQKLETKRKRSNVRIANR